MKAQAIFLSKGEVKLREIEVPRPGRSEVLIETKACGICMGDIYVYEGMVPSERAMGHEGVGVVADVGDAVNNVRCGDKVTTLGGPAFADYYLTDNRNVAKIPDGVGDFTLWISEPPACAVNGIRGSEIQIGDDVCIVGCGYMGLLLIQAMPRNITGNIVALDIRDERLALAKRFGADFALNPAKGDAVEGVHGLLGDEADVVIEASGAHGTLGLATELVRPGGKLTIFGRHVMDEVVPTEKWHGKGLRILNTAPAFSVDFNRDFRDAVRLLGRGVFDQKPLITHRFPNEDAQTAFKIAAERHVDYIKGVITF